MREIDKNLQAVLSEPRIRGNHTMSIYVQCECGQRLRARDEFAGKRGECRYCGRVLTIPSGDGGQQPPETAGQAAPGARREEAVDVTEFFDPPVTVIERERRKSMTLRAMFEALLDPRSIHWMLTLGGGLAVLGLIVWLTSLGIFKNPVIMAVALGAGTLAILVAGWFVVLRTRFKIAGQALTFLGCVVAPLNLWFYHAQQLVTLENRLWLGGLVCSLLYIATVYVLRDPLFMYAVEVGVTLTMALFLADLGLANDTASLSLMLMALGLVSIHAERAFPPGEGVFNRQRFGLPLFWSGHAQAGSSLCILLGTQIAGWLLDPAHAFFGATWAGNLLTESSLVAAGLWLAGTYAYLYSDIVVRRVGIYTYLAAFCLVLAEVTLVGMKLHGEGLIAVLALTALAANLIQNYVAARDQKLSRAVPPLAIVLSALPVLIGMGLHLRATSAVAASFEWSYETGWWFVIVMLVVAASNRVSAYLYRRTAPKSASLYFFFSAAGLIVAAAGLLRMLDLTAWTQQAPLLMLVPLAYLVASRLWRGHSPEQPLYWVAQTATAVILAHVLFASLEMLESVVRPIQEETANLLLGLVFVEAAVFYTLAAIFRRRSLNVYLATAAACGALWQLLGYWGVHSAYYTMLYAALGVGFLGICRALGVEERVVYRPDGGKALATRGRGLAAFQSGNAILSIALLAAFLQGFMRLAAQATDWRSFWALAWTVTASAIAVALAPAGSWRRLYTTASIGLAGVAFLTLNVLIDLTLWQKLEIFCVVVGVFMIAISYVGRFREVSEEPNEMVTGGLWLGSLLATLPLLVAVIYHRFPGGDISLLDELALLAVTLPMLVTGYSWHIKSTTFFGGCTLVFYLLVIVVSLGWKQQVAVGVYLAVGGGLVFALGIALSIYREKLLELPNQIARREGIFTVINWR
jgi:hypothetical protein